MAPKALREIVTVVLARRAFAVDFNLASTPRASSSNQAATTAADRVHALVPAPITALLDAVSLVSQAFAIEYSVDYALVIHPFAGFEPLRLPGAVAFENVVVTHHVAIVLWVLLAAVGSLPVVVDLPNAGEADVERALAVVRRFITFTI